MRRRTFALIVAVLVLGWPGVAHAKGPNQATIEGETLTAPLTIGVDGGGNDFDKLLEQTGFGVAMYTEDASSLLDAAPTANLGPAFQITWRVAGGGPDWLHQTLYPYAEDGPLTYTEPGLHGRGGWFQAPQLLPTTLKRLGIPVPAGYGATPATTPAPARPVPSTATNPAPANDGSALWPKAGFIAMVAAAAAAGALILGRRHVRVAPA